MAVTGFWPIYKNLKATPGYADNPDKTTAREYLDDDLLSNRIRRPKAPEDENQNKESRKAISKQMKPVRERLRRAEKILENPPHLYELLKQEHEFERKARARYLDRSR